MSLSRIRSCANCRRNELEDQVEIKTCSQCQVIPFCSDLCESEIIESHKCKELSCDDRKTKCRALLEVALTTDNCEALEKLVNLRETWKMELTNNDLDLIDLNRMSLDDWNCWQFSTELPDFICVYIELGTF